MTLRCTSAFFYPIVDPKKSSVTREFLSGAFYFGSKKLVHLSTDADVMRLGWQTDKKIAFKNVLKVALLVTGIFAIIAAVYKISQCIAFRKYKQIIIESNPSPKTASITGTANQNIKKDEHKPKKIETITPVQKNEKLLENDPSKSAEINKTVIEIGKKDSELIPKEAFEKKLAEEPFIQTIKVFSKAALIKEYIWLADLLKNKPELKLECDSNEEEIDIEFEDALLIPFSVFSSRCMNFADLIIGSFAYGAGLDDPEVNSNSRKFLAEVVLYWVQHADLTKAYKFREDLVLTLDLIKTGKIKNHNEEAIAKLKKVVSQKGVDFWKDMSSEKLQSIASSFQIPKNTTPYYQNEIFKKEFLKKHLFQLLKNSEIFPYATWQEKLDVLNKLSPYISAKDLTGLVSMPADAVNYHIKFDEDIFVGFNICHLMTILKDEKLNPNSKVMAFKEALDFMKQFETKQHNYRFFGEVFASLDLSEQDVEIVLRSLNYQGINRFLEELIRLGNKSHLQSGFKKFLQIRHEIDQRHPNSLTLILEHIKDLDTAMAIYESVDTREGKEEVKNFLLKGITREKVIYKTSLSEEDVKKLSETVDKIQ